VVAIERKVGAPELVAVLDDGTQKSVSMSPTIGWACELKFLSACWRSEITRLKNELPVAMTRIGAGASQMLLV
jgi:hypothetical protein